MTCPIIYSPECIEYSSPGHPESPERITSAHAFLADKYELIDARPATDTEITTVHSQTHLESVEDRTFIDPDCPRHENIIYYARLSAGAAIQASQHHGFSLMRPPGHHASADRVSGFCYFNNIAIAVRVSGKQTLIVDIDGHHGDGTELIFMSDPNVLFVSLHSSPNYPGTGLESVNNCHNYPLPFGCGDEIYLQTLSAALGRLDLRNLEQIAVSAGFDAFETDPLASLGLSRSCYNEIGKLLANLELPAFAVLEGGYDPANLGPNIDAFLRGLYSPQAGISV